MNSNNSQNSNKKYYKGVSNTVFTEDVYAKNDLDVVVSCYKKAVKFALQKEHPIRDNDVKDEPPIDMQYIEFANEIKNNLKTRLKHYRAEYIEPNESNTFIRLKAFTFNIISKMFEKQMQRVITREYLEEKYGVSKKQFKLISDARSVMDLSYDTSDNYIYYFLKIITDNVEKEYKASQQTGGKSKKDKIKLKEDSKQYVVHLTDKKQKFIKRKGINVLLNSIRGKYNYVL
jgi:hypothetical protein